MLSEILAHSQQSVCNGLKGIVVNHKRHLPGEVVKEVVEENHGNYTLSITRLLGPELCGSQGNPNCERAAHSTGGNQKERTASETIDHTSPEPSLKHVDHQNKSVELVLVLGASDTDVQQNVV